MDTLVLAAEEASDGLPAEVWGIGAFAILLLGLAAVLIFGKGRPHA